MKTYRDLDVYQRAYRLSIEIHKFSFTLPKLLQYDLGDQLRRASRSIPSNIAEAYDRNKSAKDKINFLSDSLGSNEEVLFYLEFLKDVGLIEANKFSYFKNEYTICGRQLLKLIRSLRQQDN